MGENVQGESAAKGYVQDINLGHVLKQSGHNTNVRKQKEEIAVSVVLVIVGRSEVAAGPHGTAAAVLRLERLCAYPQRRY